jgi:hypothetical protein
VAYAPGTYGGRNLRIGHELHGLDDTPQVERKRPLAEVRRLRAAVQPPANPGSVHEESGQKHDQRPEEKRRDQSDQQPAR